MKTGTVLDLRRSGEPRTFEENIDRVSQAFTLSHTKLQLPRLTVQKVFQKTLTKWKSYRHLSQMTSRNDISFALNMLEAFLKRVCFSDDTSFHVSGKLNRHNMRTCGSEYSYLARELST